MLDTAGTAAPVTVVHDLDDDPASVAVEPHLGVSTGTGVLETLVSASWTMRYANRSNCPQAAATC